MRTVTLCLPVTSDKVLLGLKKKGFGEGKWNGFGGKVKEDESIEKAALRELKEECGISSHERALEKVAVLDFLHPDNPAWNQQMHVYVLREWEGEPQESDEMKPLWHEISNLPLDAMWVSDQLWMQRALLGEKFRGEVCFKNQNMMESSRVEPVFSFS